MKFKKKMENKGTSLKIKTMFIIIIILTVSIGATMGINIIQVRSSLKEALENEIYSSGLLIRSTIYKNLRYFELKKFSGMKNFLRNILKTNKNLAYCFISAAGSNIVLYHNDPTKMNLKLNPKVFNDKILNLKKVTISLGKYYETILPIIHKGNRIGNIHVGVKKAVIDNKLLKLIITTAIIFVLSLLISIFLLMLFINKKIVKPIAYLSNEMEDITNEMKFDTEVVVNSNDEIGVLAKDFNIMINEIRNYSYNLEELVDERTKELNEANSELQVKSCELKNINKKLLKDLEMAKRIQESIIKNMPDFPEIFVDAEYMAMESLGGDLYDVRRIGKCTYSFMISDVSGHGVPAALITTMAKTSFINHSHFSKPPSQTCEEVNQDLYELIGDTEYYLTAFYAMLDIKTLELKYTNCAHQKAIVYKNATGEIETLDSNGMFLGSFEEPEYIYETIKLDVNDKILFYTDGITEARNEKEEFYTVNSLMNFVKENGKSEPKEFLKLFLKEMEEFCGARPADDDRALLLVQLLEVTTEEGEEVAEIYADGITTKRQSDEFDNKIKIFREIFDSLNLHDKSLHEHIKSSIKLYRDSKYEETIDILDKFLPYFMDNENILSIMAAVYYKKNELKNALELYEKIKSINPKFPHIDETITRLLDKIEA